MSGWGGRGAASLTRLTLETYGTTCHLCLKPVRLDAPPRHPMRPSADHVVPRSLGGTNAIGNLRPAHYGCNSRRGARPLTPALLAEFRAPRAAPRAVEDRRAFFGRT